MRGGLLAALFIAFVSAASGAVSGTTQDTVPLAAMFSAEQVEEGRRLFADTCATCHGPNLEGAVGPSLTIPAFRSNYSNKPVRALYSKIISTMPVGQPGTLSEAQVLKLTALIYASNGLPVGITPVLSASELSASRFPEAAKW